MRVLIPPRALSRCRTYPELSGNRLNPEVISSVDAGSTLGDCASRFPLILLCSPRQQVRPSTGVRFHTFRVSKRRRSPPSRPRPESSAGPDGQSVETTGTHQIPSPLHAIALEILRNKDGPETNVSLWRPRTAKEVARIPEQLDAALEGPSPVSRGLLVRSAPFTEDTGRKVRFRLRIGVQQIIEALALHQSAGTYDKTAVAARTLPPPAHRAVCVRDQRDCRSSGHVRASPRTADEIVGPVGHGNHPSPQADR